MSEAVSVDRAYAELVKACLDGETVRTRNSVVRRCTNKMFTFRTTPLVGVRRTAWKSALREMEWFLSGSSRTDDLHPAVRPWWEPWASGGEVKYNYSRQFRHYNGRFDQIAHLIDGVKNHPNSRRNVITTWNAEEMAAADCPITNCHNSLTQAFVDGDGRLSLTTYQRSCDVIVGLGANWIQMAAFQLWLAARTGREVDSLTWIGGDCHVYEAHLELAAEIVGRAGECRPTPTLVLTMDEADAFRADNFSLDMDYEPVIDRRAEMVV